MLLPGAYISIAHGNFRPVALKSSIRRCFCIELDGSKLLAETNSKQDLESSVFSIVLVFDMGMSLIEDYLITHELAQVRNDYIS